MKDFNPFFLKNEKNLFTGRSIPDECVNPSNYVWLISSDSIFSSDISGYENYARFFGMKFHVSRFSVFDGTNASDSAVAAQDMTIYISPGISCAMIQSRMAKGTIISKITLKKIVLLQGSTQILEAKEFSQCVVQSFSRTGELAAFTFRYSSYSDSYTDFKKDGTQAGTAATNVNLATWVIEDQ